MTDQLNSPTDLGQPHFQDPLFRGVSLCFRDRFFPLGTLIQVESNHEAVIQAARKSFGHFELPSFSGRPEILLQLCVDPERHDEDSHPIACFRSLRHIFHIACGDHNFAVADLVTSCAVGFVSLEMAQNTEFFRNTFLECLLHVLLVHRSHTPVHCSGVALDGRGILICGHSGVGKTTLAYACAKSGLQVLSDDVVHLRTDPVSGKLLLWGNPWYLRLSPDAVRLFPELQGEKASLRSDDQWYLEIDVPSRFPGRTVVSCQPVGMVFLEPNHDVPPGLYPMSPESALEQLKKDIVLDEETILRRHCSVLEQLVEMGTFKLHYRGNPLVAVKEIESLLREGVSKVQEK